MFIRVLATVALCAAYGLFMALMNAPLTLLSARVAGDQFVNSDAAAMTVAGALHLFQTATILPLVALLVALVALWAKPALRALSGLLAVLALTCLALAPTPAHAFAETADRTEAYTILPNESAFWVPDTGANKETQTQFDSESYLAERKLAAKRFVVPHAKLSGSGGTSFLSGPDYYVPSGRLVIVDRTPYSREWVSAAHRGTSARDESFPCQSKDGLNIGIGISIGTSVSEANAARYLYRFGVKPPTGNRGDIQTIFTSVYYGRSLAEVMDDVGRKATQAAVCTEIGQRTFDKANEDMNVIMANVEKKMTSYFAGMGIGLDFIGYADSFHFDEPVQKAVNDRYAADKLANVIPVLQALAQLKVQEGMGKGLETKGLPVVVTPDMINTLIHLSDRVPPQTARENAPPSTPAR